MNLGYIISTIIASLILLSLVGLNSRIMRSSGEQTLYTMAKIHSDMVVDYLQDDMRSMGYQINTAAITLADSNRIRFLVRFEGNAEATAIDWWFDADAAATGRNPNVRPLYRRISAHDADPNYDPATDPGTDAVGTGVVEFRLEYLDADREIIAIEDVNAQLDNVRQIRLNLITESLDSYEANRFNRSTWSGEFTPFNLVNN